MAEIRSGMVGQVGQASTMAMLPPGELKPWPKNPRNNKAAVSKVAASIQQFGFASPIVARLENRMIIAGHTRWEAALLLRLPEVPVRLLDISAKGAELLALADNRLGEIATWDDAMLAALVKQMEVEGLDLSVAGFERDEISALLGSLEQEQREKTKLSVRFLVPPFSVLDARAGYWQERKAQWLALGIKSEIGRGGNLLKMSDTMLQPDAKERSKARQRNGNLDEAGKRAMGVYQAGAGGIMNRGFGSSTGTSIFDPVLCELAYRWFSPIGGQVLDPFAGGSVRGVVASRCGRRYLGIDLRHEQVEANREQAKKLCADDAAPPPPAETLIDEPGLTPLQEVPFKGGTLLLKRDDLFHVAGARGGKARAIAAMLKDAKGVVTAGNRHSPMLSRVARVAWKLGLPSRGYASGSKELLEIEQDAQAFGMELVKEPGVNYLSALISRAKKDAEARGWVFAPLGVEGHEYFELSKEQVANIPEAAKRIVITVGSGMTLAALLAGLDARGLKIPVLGVQVGMDPAPLLDRWAPKDWRERVRLVKPARSFEEAEAEFRLGPVELDPHYEAKALPFLEPGDLFWVIAIRSAGVGPESLPEQKALGPSWARGFQLSGLKTIAALFREFDKPFVQGAFTQVRENTVAEWLDKGQLRVLSINREPQAAVVVQPVKNAAEVLDFSGERVGNLAAGDVRITRLAARPGRELLLLQLIEQAKGERGEMWVEPWQESAEMQAVAARAGLHYVSSKVRASSEIVGLWTGSPFAGGSVPERNQWTLRRLGFVNPDGEIAAAAAAVEREALAWADHYSSYNKRRSWSALALRGYGGDPNFIEKPAEMSKKWKEENSEKLGWTLKDTPLRAQLPALEPLIAAIPGVKHRIRLMRLTPGGGELTRHADITDPDAGTAAGRTLRIHIPITTNPGVLFEQWNIQGERLRAHMQVGTAWYLDTRKPHRAKNGGTTERIHLVMDVESNPELLALLNGGEEAAVIEGFGEPVLKPVDELTDQLEPFSIARAADEGGDLGAARVGEVGPMPVWECGDSRDLDNIAAGVEADLVFSCPPYADLEVYSDDPRDLSTLGYAEFLDAYGQIIGKACAKLKANRFACFVVGDVRDKKGLYRNFVSHTIGAFEAAGLRLYNEGILVTPCGTLALRAGGAFSASRKLGKTHQNVLVFVKGDPKKATAACGEVEIMVPEESA
jgi:hypothetical protein